MDWDPNLPLWSLDRVWSTFSCYCDWFCVAKTWELLCLRNIYCRVFSSHMSFNSLNWLCILSFWTLVSDKECFAMSSFPHWYQACNLCTTVWDMWLLLHCELLQQKFRTKNLVYAFADFEQVSYQHTSSLAADEVVSRQSLPFVMKVTLGLMFCERHFKGYNHTLSSHVCFAVVGNWHNSCNLQTAVDYSLQSRIYMC